MSLMKLLAKEFTKSGVMKDNAFMIGFSLSFFMMIMPTLTSSKEARKESNYCNPKHH